MLVLSVSSSINSVIRLRELKGCNDWQCRKLAQLFENRYAEFAILGSLKPVRSSPNMQFDHTTCWSFADETIAGYLAKSRMSSILPDTSCFNAILLLVVLRATTMGAASNPELSTNYTNSISLSRDLRTVNSFEPTQGPTASSMLLALIPSYLPSPSFWPSNHPSDGPTMLPSSTPTTICHDRAEYRSPIIRLPWIYHRGMDCTSWKYVLGGIITAVENLINSCPVSCNAPCGAFSLHTFDLSLTVSNISSLLDVLMQTPLENAALDYGVLATVCQRKLW